MRMCSVTTSSLLPPLQPTPLTRQIKIGIRCSQSAYYMSTCRTIIYRSKSLHMTLIRVYLSRREPNWFTRSMYLFLLACTLPIPHTLNNYIEHSFKVRVKFDLKGYTIFIYFLLRKILLKRKGGRGRVIHHCCHPHTQIEG